MNKPRIVHLLEDSSFGGITENLKLFDSPEIAERYDVSIKHVSPAGRIAPRIGADIIVIHYTHSWSRLPFLWSLRQRNRQAKIVHMEHSYSAEWADIYVPNLTRFRSLMKLVGHNIDMMVCVSKSQHDWIVSLVPDLECECTTINPFSDMTPLLALTLPDFRPSKALTLGSFGRFHSDKGFDTLIEIINEIPVCYNLRLIIGGFGEDEEQLQSLASANPTIFFAGRVNDKAAFMQQCDIIVIPSRYETFGLTAAEAKAAGRPILVSDVGALAEQVNDPRQICDFSKPAEVMARLSSMGELPLQRLAEKGRADISRFGQHIMKNWIALIDGQLAH